MKSSLLILILILFCGLSWAAGRRALLVLVGQYPEGSGWNSLSSSNDREIVISMLQENGFARDDISILENSSATFSRIRLALEELCRETRDGDFVYIHFSCHGQQITDVDGDEGLRDLRDRYDEALVPYDATVSYGRMGYRGEHHLTDDILNSYLSRISLAAGKKGSVIVLADACHSGDIGRASDDEEESLYPYRGTFDAFEMPRGPVEEVFEPQVVTWISVGACKSFQTNFEVEIGGKRYGRLSYAISKVFSPSMSPVQLETALRECYLSLPMPPGKVQSISMEYPDEIRNKPMSRK